MFVLILDLINFILVADNVYIFTVSLTAKEHKERSSVIITVIVRKNGVSQVTDLIAKKVH